ncbi:MAG: GNAT family N-acetyltransferase [bacterium]
MNIILRPLQENDNKLFHRWWNDQEICMLTSATSELMPFDEINEIIIKHLINPDGTDFIIEADSQPIGHILIKKDQRKKYYSVYIAIGEKDYWGKGYGTKALMLACNWFWQKFPHEEMLELEVNTTNRRAYHCYEKVGFCKIRLKKYKDFPETYLMRINRD